MQSTQAQAIATGVMRAQFEHAIAVLIGVPPAELSIAPTDYMIEIPEIPPGLPSALLERRPDIAAGERTMASANAEIGVEVAAFYPTITLSADAGTSAASLNKLIGETGEFWSFGANLAQTVFDAGLRNARVQEAVAVFDQDLANYRQTVLTAFQQVEDQLAALRILAEEAKVQDAAVVSAREAVRVLNNQYLAGTVAYTSVIVAEQTALGNAETALTIRENRLIASASLIQALGGGLGCSAAAEPRAHRRGRPAQLQPAAADTAGARPLNASGEMRMRRYRNSLALRPVLEFLTLDEAELAPGSLEMALPRIKVRARQPHPLSRSVFGLGAHPVLRASLTVAWLLISGVSLAQECPLTAPLIVKDVQDGFAGQTGTVRTIAPDCSFTVARQFGLKIADPHRRGQLTSEQQARLKELLTRMATAASPQHLGGPPQVNARRITLSYGGKVSELTLAPGAGDLDALRAAAGNDPAARVIELADAVKGMTGG